MYINLKEMVVSEQSSIKDCMNAININKLGIVFICASKKESKIIGVLTDGDIRDLILKDFKLNNPIKNIHNKDFVWFDYDSPREDILRKLDSNIKVIPLLDSEMKLVDIATRDYLPIKNEKKTYARCKAPARVTFGGGGSDLTHFFTTHDGAVINAAISLYCHTTLKKRSDKKIIINSIDLENEWEINNLDDVFKIEDKDFGLFRSILNAIRPSYGFELDIYTEFPKGSGLGGSSVVSAAIIGCFNEFRDDKWDNHEIAELAFQAERLHMNVAGGWQDQYATVFGGFNFMEFNKNKNNIHNLKVQEKTILEMEENFLLYELPKGRTIEGDSIHKDQKNSMQSKEVQSKVKEAVNLCYLMKDNLLRGHLKSFGESLDTAWKLKRQFSNKISNSTIDEVYDYAIKSGALGGKLLGAGGGGFFLFYVEPLKKYSFIKKMHKKKMSPTKFSFESNGLRSWSTRIE